MERFAPLAVQRPIAFGAALGVMVRLATEPSQLVVVGDDAEAVSSVARHWQQTGAVTAVVTPDQAMAFAEAGFELFEGRTSQGGATAYYCRDFVCRLPVSDAESLRELLP